MNFDVALRSNRTVGETEVFGFGFTNRTPETFMAIADMMFSDQAVLQNRLNRRQVRQGFFAGTARFAYWTFAETFRAVRYSLGMIGEKAVVSAPDAPIALKRDVPTELLIQLAQEPEHYTGIQNHA